MKLKFKISQAVNLDKWAIIDRIQTELDKKNYRILNLTGDIVEFDDSPWRLMWNFQAIRRINGGKFEINVQDGLILITFSYYLSLIAPIALLTIISVCLIKDGEYYAPLFFILFYTIAITIQTVILKDVARAMLNNIAN